MTSSDPAPEYTVPLPAYLPPDHRHLSYLRGMASSAQDEVSFTELLQHPTDVTRRLDRVRSLRIRRRDAGDLVLVAADRIEQEYQVVDIVARLLGELLRDDDTRDAVADVVVRVIPWARFLPPDDLQLMMTELIETATAGASIHNLAPLSLLLTQWRNTAEIHADPELAAALARPFEIVHGGVVPRPEAEG